MFLHFCEMLFLELKLYCHSQMSHETALDFKDGRVNETLYCTIAVSALQPHHVQTNQSLTHSMCRQH